MVAGSRVAIAQAPSKVYRGLYALPECAVRREIAAWGDFAEKAGEARRHTRQKPRVRGRAARVAKVSKLGEMVNGMKANGVDVIVAGGFPTTLACKVANVPTVVFAGVG